MAPAVFALTENAMGLFPFISGVLGIFAAIGFAAYVLSHPRGDDTMNEIADAIEVGAYAFIATEYFYLFWFIMVLNILIMAAISPYTGICYLVGAFTSAACGFFGMAISVKANIRTAEGARSGLNKALRVSLSSGAVMGLCVVSIALISLSVLYLLFGTEAAFTSISTMYPAGGYMPGFGMGASSVSLFTRVGGGIYTKAADVGADLVGKVEAGIPEDDARNPATIADNVGDNVGDVAGMGADIFGSFAGSIIASCLLAFAQWNGKIVSPELGVCNPGNMAACGALAYFALPYWISATGIFASIIGLLAVQTKEDATPRDVLGAVRNGLFIAMFFQIGFMAVIIYVLQPSTEPAIITQWWKMYACIIIGLFCGRSIGLNTEYFTSYEYNPTISISKAGLAGPASVIIQGLSMGMLSTIFPGLCIAGTVLATINLAGFYGLALASTGLLSNLGITLATDAFGPVADNAGGIAEMAQMPEEVRHRTDVLDALGNTTAAIGKGFAMASAVLTGLGLLFTFVTRVGINGIDVITNPNYPQATNPSGVDYYSGALGFTMAGLLVGAMIPFAFGAVTMSAVAKAARGVVFEVRRQFKEMPGIMNRTQKPDYAKCVALVTKFSIMQLLIPAIVVVFPPIIIGIGLGPHCLGGMLASLIVGSFILGLTMSASGGAWDNAKKYVEGGKLRDKVTGKVIGRKTDCHKAVVVGDTVGDPFKDTSGPSLNILVKLSTYMGVVLARIFQNQLQFWWAAIIITGVLGIFVPWWVMHLIRVLKSDEANSSKAAVDSGDVEKAEAPLSGGPKKDASKPVVELQSVTTTPEAVNVSVAIDAVAVKAPADVTSTPEEEKKAEKEAKKEKSEKKKGK